jgi:hypothetical protein
MECGTQIQEPKPESASTPPPHMGERFIRLVGRLRLAQESVAQELEPLQEAEGPDNSDQRIWQLYVRVRDLSAEADALLLDMNERGSPISLITAAEALSDFFWDTRKRIATML